VQRRYSVKAACTCVLRICYVAADVFSLFVSRSLSGNGHTRYSIDNRSLTSMFHKHIWADVHSSMRICINISARTEMSARRKITFVAIGYFISKLQNNLHHI
jgi:hypothetical protein